MIAIEKCHGIQPEELDDVEDAADAREADDIRARFAEWDPLRDVAGAFDSWANRRRRRHHDHARLLRGWRRRLGRR